MHLQAVVPLNEECGFIEWVPSTRGFRNIVLDIYKEIGASCGTRELLAYRVPITEPVQYVVCVCRIGSGCGKGGYSLVIAVKIVSFYYWHSVFFFFARLSFRSTRNVG